VHVFVNILNIVIMFTIRLWNTFCENGHSVAVFFFRFCRYVGKISLHRCFSQFSYLLINLHSSEMTMSCRMKHATTSQAKKSVVCSQHVFAVLALFPAPLFTILIVTDDVTKTLLKCPQYSFGIYAEYLCYGENNN